MSPLQKKNLVTGSRFDDEAFSFLMIIAEINADNRREKLLALHQKPISPEEQILIATSLKKIDRLLDEAEEMAKGGKRGKMELLIKEAETLARKLEKDIGARVVKILGICEENFGNKLNIPMSLAVA